MTLSPKGRQLRVLVLDALERRARQFRGNEDLWPFRVPHDPLDLQMVIDDALADAAGALRSDDLPRRPVMSMEWADGHRWQAAAITLPSGIHLYVDSDGAETRMLASAKRGSAVEADRFFLELLAESRGHAFNIEMGGAAPATVRTPIDDRALLADVFVDLFEGTPAERQIWETTGSIAGGDFRHEIERWLERVLTAPASRARRRFRRLRELDLS